MLSDKKIILSLILSVILLLSFSCDKKKSIPKLDFNDSKQVLEILKNHFNKNVAKVFIGNFDNENQLSVIACVEVCDSISCGVNFYHLKQEKGEIVVLYETGFIEGQLKDYQLEKIKVSDFPYEMVYFNSGSYYMGSAGGEVFSYLIDFNQRQVYYAHFVNDIEHQYELFISENTTDIKLRNFFIATFKRNFNKVKVVDKDIKLDY